MPTPRSSLCLVLVLATVGLLAGCEASVSTGGDSVDAGDAANTIQKQYPAKAGGLKLTSIDCDSGDAKVDAKFTCTGVNDNGITLDIEATVNAVDKDTGKVDFTWSITKSVSDGTAFSGVALTTLQNQGSAVKSIECPELVVEKGTEVDCNAIMKDGSEQTATIMLTDGNGGFNVDLSGPQ